MIKIMTDGAGKMDAYPYLNKSYVLTWANSRMEELKSSDEITTQNLFVGLMYGLATFVKDDPHRNKILKSNDPTKHYSTDSSLFELGCYLYVQIDLWLFLKRPNLREKISAVFIREFNKLFSNALGISQSYLHELFEERVCKYSDLIRKGQTIEEYYLLSQLILYTKDGAIPGKHDFNKMELVMNFLDDCLVKVKLGSWVTIMLPSIIGSLKEYCNLLESKS